MGLWISILLLLIVVVLWQVYTQIEAFSSRGSNDFVPRNCESARQEYLRANADVRDAGVDPWTHWNDFGKNEGRAWPRCTEPPSFGAAAAAPATGATATAPATAATAPATAAATTAATAPATAAATAPATAATAAAVPAQGVAASVAPTTSSQGAAFSVQDILAAVSAPRYTDQVSQPSVAPPPSAASTKEMEERLAKKITSQIKSELLSQRSTEHPLDNKYAPCELSPSDAEAQGAEYTEAKPGFNINEYVRKDSIPCWACSLPPA